MSAEGTHTVTAKRVGGAEEEVTLTFSALRLFSHGVYSNVYTGTIHDGGEERTIAIKKCWGSEEDMKEIRILERLNRFAPKNIVNLLYIFSKTHGDRVSSPFCNRSSLSSCPTRWHVWSAGCVLAEMLRGRTFLAGSSTDNQLEKIVDCFGLPTADQLRAMHARRARLLEKPPVVRAAENFEARGRNALPRLLPDAPLVALALVEKICSYTPSARLHGPKLLGHPFFDEIFDSNSQRNGRPLDLLTRSDLARAVAGDVSRETLESHTGPGSAEPNR
ncbi:Protein kinase domain-containing protein [Aphelenchoides fujianensis]|nr:Protein kinase domain-containing protein [Aphelenchoides fujianensis]